MPLDILMMRPDLLRLSSGASSCASCSGPSVLVSSVARTVAKSTFSAAFFAFGDDAGVVDQHIEMAEAVLEKVAQRGNTFAVGHVESVKLTPSFSFASFSIAASPAVVLRAVSTTRAPRAASCRQISSRCRDCRQ